MGLPLLPILALSFTMGGIGYFSAYIEPSAKGRKAIDEVFEASSFYTYVTEGTLRPQYIKKKRFKWGMRYFYDLPKGLSSEDAKKLTTRLSEALKRDVEISFDYCTMIDVYNEKMGKVIKFDESLLNLKDYKVPLGLNHKGEVVELDFTGPFSHLLIGGISGAGKSQLVHLILTALSLKEKRADLYLCDLKFGVELQDYEGMEHVKGFVTTLDDLDMMLDLVIEDMKQRYQLMRKNNQNHFQCH